MRKTNRAFDDRLDALITRKEARWRKAHAYFEIGEKQIQSELEKARASIKKHCIDCAASNCRKCGKTDDASFQEEALRHLNLRWDDDEREDTVVRWHLKGVTVQSSYSQPTKIESVHLDFTPEQWLLMKEGEFLPACCGNISAVRDNLFAAVREDGYMRAEDLRDSAYLLENHDDCGTLEPDHPVRKIVELFHLVKNELVPEQTPVTSNPDNPIDAIDMLASDSTISRAKSL